MIIRILKEDGSVAECEITMNEWGTYLLLGKKNVKSVYTDMIQGENGFQDMIEIEFEYYKEENMMKIQKHVKTLIQIQIIMN